jgi:hypothetical protein
MMDGEVVMLVARGTRGGFLWEVAGEDLREEGSAELRMQKELVNPPRFPQ